MSESTAHLLWRKVWLKTKGSGSQPGTASVSCFRDKDPETKSALDCFHASQDKEQKTQRLLPELPDRTASMITADDCKSKAGEGRVWLTMEYGESGREAGGRSVDTVGAAGGGVVSVSGAAAAGATGASLGLLSAVATAPFAAAAPVSFGDGSAEAPCKVVGMGGVHSRVHSPGQQCRSLQKDRHGSQAMACIGTHALTGTGRMQRVRA